MNEQSIAEATLELARDGVPAGATLRSVQMIVGPMRGIDPQFMHLAWQALGQADVALMVCVLPWTLQCAACGRRWEQPELAERCDCGSAKVTPIGGNELELHSIEIDD
jgi:Zn finger protein HypA/HybF involved in hydrogenase expression